MQYRNIVEGRFLSRPNRFIAFVETEEGDRQLAMSRTPGDAKSFSFPAQRCIWEKAGIPKEKTARDLVAVRKGERLFKHGQQRPECRGRRISAGLFSRMRWFLNPRRFYGNSRMDFDVETAEKQCYIEVKGADSAVEGGRALFPDAPTERGL